MPAHVAPSQNRRHPARVRASSAILTVATIGGLLVGTTTGVSAAPSTQPATCGTLATHSVVAGESWFVIAKTVSVKMGALVKANDAVITDVIWPGEVLCLPEGAIVPAAPAPAPAADPAVVPTGTGTCAASYNVVKGDSWFGIAKASGVKPAALTAANGATYVRVLQVGDQLCLPEGATPLAATPPPADTGCSSTYVVRSGDSWFALASRAGTSARSLTKANDKTLDTALHPGDELCLPAGASLVDPVNGTGFVTLTALPLQGPCGYGDSWGAARGAGRTHEGIDMFAVPGQYVYAVTDGVLTRRAWDQPGLRAGNAWWLRSADGSGTSYFYAHLSAFAPDLEVGSTVKAGQIIGFVGATGNAAGPHLHFEIHPNGGRAINPYASVKAAGGCNDGPGYVQPGGWVPEGK